MGHNTGYEVPSNDILDFEDNCENLDRLMNVEEDYWEDRLGNKRPTIDYALRMAGFSPAGFDFTTGGVLQPGDRNKCVFNQTDQTWYSYTGNLPYNVVAGSLPNNNWKVVNRNALTIAREALRRTYQEVGLNLVAGSFEAGATIEFGNDVVLQEKTGKCYSGPIGQIPKGTNPLTGGFVDKTNSSFFPELSPFLKNRVYLESLSHMVVNGDWTIPINYAIQNFSEIVPELNKNYIIAGIIVGKVGVKIIGSITITPTHPRLTNLGTFTVDTSNQSRGIKALYVFGTFDVVEMLFIKSMGFNLIQHGAYFQFNAPGLDREVHITKALDSASIANLEVCLTSGWITQDDSQAIGTANLFDHHPALIGYSVFDEPSFNNVSVARQNERIAALRAVSNKTLTVVDNSGHGDWFSGFGVLSKNYDLVFIDVYPSKLGSQRSVGDVLMAHAAIRNATGNKIVIPVSACFLGTTFSTDLTTVKNIAKRHFSLSGDNLSFWGWDPVEEGITSIALTNPDLRKMMLSLMQPIRKYGEYDFFYVGKNKPLGGFQEPIKSMELRTDIGTSAGIFFHCLEHGTVESETECANVALGQTISGIFALEGTNELITNISIKSDSVLKGIIGNVNGNSSLTLDIYAVSPTNKRLLLFREGYTFTQSETNKPVGPIFIPGDSFAGHRISIVFSGLKGMGNYPRTFFQMMFAGER